MFRLLAVSVRSIGLHKGGYQPVYVVVVEYAQESVLVQSVYESLRIEQDLHRVAQLLDDSGVAVAHNPPNDDIQEAHVVVLRAYCP